MQIHVYVTCEWKEHGLLGIEGESDLDFEKETPCFVLERSVMTGNIVRAHELGKECFLDEEQARADLEKRKLAEERRILALYPDMVQFGTKEKREELERLYDRVQMFDPKTTPVKSLRR